MDLLHPHSLPGAFTLPWPVWIAAAGASLFCLLGLYAAALLLVGHRAPGKAGFLQPPTLRGRIALGLVTASVLPAVSLALVLTERTTDERLGRSSSLLQSHAAEAARTADQFLTRNQSMVDSLAQHLSISPDPRGPGTAATLLGHHRAYPQFTMLLVLGEAGEVHAATVHLNGQPIAVPPESVVPPGPAWTRAALAAPGGEAVAAITEPDPGWPPGILLAARLRDADGQSAGVVMGALSTEILAATEGELATRIGAGLLLTDASGQVLAASPPPGSEGLDATGIAALVASDAAAGSAVAYRVALGEAGAILVSSRVLDNGWRAFVYAPMSRLTGALLTDYAVATGWLCLTLAIGLCLSTAIARSIVGPLNALDRAMTDFEIDIDRRMPAAPAGSPREILAVFDHLTTLIDGLRDSYSKLRNALKQGEKLRGELIYVIANREKEIEQRTRELQEANQTLHRISRVDSLTGLANRRCLAEFMEQAWRLGLRNQRPVSLLVLDIDDFKLYNDTWGHQLGDECLHAVAEVVAAAVSRPTDLAARYGGEEFVVVLGDTPLEGALQVAERVRQGVADLRLDHPGQAPSQVTVSVGVCSSLPTRATQPETLLVAADHAMYKAKRNGKNQVAYSTPTHTGIFQSLCLPSQAESRLS